MNFMLFSAVFRTRVCEATRRMMNVRYRVVRSLTTRSNDKYLCRLRAMVLRDHEKYVVSNCSHYRDFYARPFFVSAVSCVAFGFVYFILYCRHSSH